MTAITLIFGIHNMQYFEIRDECLMVKSLFGTIVKLDIENVDAYIETLPTYSSWVLSANEKWICLYDKSISNNICDRFKSGCANKRHHKRVQIICSDENRHCIEKYIEIKTRNVNPNFRSEFWYT